MNRQELAQWHRDQAEILDSGKPLERRHLLKSTWVDEAHGDSIEFEYRLAPERKPIPDYDLTESEVKALIEEGYLQIAQDGDGTTFAYGATLCGNFFRGTHSVGENRYTGTDWRESLRTLKDYV